MCNSSTLPLLIGGHSASFQICLHVFVFLPLITVLPHGLIPVYFTCQEFFVSISTSALRSDSPSLAYQWARQTTQLLKYLVIILMTPVPLFPHVLGWLFLQNTFRISSLLSISTTTVYQVVKVASHSVMSL